MRTNYSVDKQITFNNSECLTQQYTVYGENIEKNKDGKKIIKSGAVLGKDSTGKIIPLQRYNPTINLTSGTSGSITLKDITGIKINDKIDFLFRGYIITFASETGNRTLTVGDESISFTMDTTPAASISNLITAYNNSPSKKYNLKTLNTTKVLLTIKSGSDNPVFDSVTGITLTTINTTSGLTGTLGTVTAINETSGVISYTSVANFSDCNLGSTSIKIGKEGLKISEVLGFVTKDYDLTNHTTKIIPVLTSSNGVYKNRISYYDQDLVARFPKIEFI